MTEQFFGKELAARKIDAIPWMVQGKLPKGKDVATWFSRIILCRRKIAK